MALPLAYENPVAVGGEAAAGTPGYRAGGAVAAVADARPEPSPRGPAGVVRLEQLGRGEGAQRALGGVDGSRVEREPVPALPVRAARVVAGGLAAGSASCLLTRTGIAGRRLGGAAGGRCRRRTAFRVAGLAA
ncbi:hypothetical protein GCM10020001_119860 [Nonomuraea salmonea]